ncbi:hypothetical protein GCK32_013856 [Trichostrongylus colubriformis]|uniref:Uncharacterized protein n=1 Tax=Trichostrongylus colubriformis TaxID=6319 RepID=A0AAN8FWI2_TRICO
MSKITLLLRCLEDEYNSLKEAVDIQKDVTHPNKPPKEDKSQIRIYCEERLCELQTAHEVVSNKFPDIATLPLTKEPFYCSDWLPGPRWFKLKEANWPVESPSSPAIETHAPGVNARLSKLCSPRPFCADKKLFTIALLANPHYWPGGAILTVTSIDSVTVLTPVSLIHELYLFFTIIRALLQTLLTCVRCVFSLARQQGEQ